MRSHPLFGSASFELTAFHSAEVIKVEHPVRGDDTRAWGPPYASYMPESGQDGPGEAAYFLGVGQPGPRPMGKILTAL